ARHGMETSRPALSARASRRAVEALSWGCEVGVGVWRAKSKGHDHHASSSSVELHVRIRLAIRVAGLLDLLRPYRSRECAGRAEVVVVVVRARVAKLLAIRGAPALVALGVGGAHRACSHVAGVHEACA